MVLKKHLHDPCSSQILFEPNVSPPIMTFYVNSLARNGKWMTTAFQKFSPPCISLTKVQQLFKGITERMIQYTCCEVSQV